MLSFDIYTDFKTKSPKGDALELFVCYLHVNILPCDINTVAYM